MNWETASAVETEAGDGDTRSRQREEVTLDAMERARDGRRPVILYISTASEDRRFQRAREMCAELESTRFAEYRTATLMQDFTLVRANVEDLDRSTLRRYGIQANAAPQILIYNSDLRRIYSMQGVPSEVVLRDRLAQAKAANDALLEQRDRAQRSTR